MEPSAPKKSLQSDSDANAYLFLLRQCVPHEEGLTITLHIVRPRAMADPSNQEVIRRYAERYPNARLILAHAARGFNPHHTISGISALQGLTNVWFDTAAVTECGAFEAIVRTLGVRRLLYGSDFPSPMPGDDVRPLATPSSGSRQKIQISRPPMARSSPR